jgi:hypothetical protein
MNLIRLMLISAALAVVCVPAAAESGGRVFIGQGSNSCGSWVSARETRSTPRGLNSQWALGFLSGVNVETTDPDILIGTDFDGLMAWIDNYCKANPLTPLVTAVMKLADELQTRVMRR